MTENRYIDGNPAKQRRLSHEEINHIWSRDRRRNRKRLLAVSLAVFVIFAVCSMVRYNAYYFDEKFVPSAYIKSWILGARLGLAKITGSYSMEQANALIENVGGAVIYTGAWARLKTGIMSFAAGAGISVAGAIFQTAYRNPMASPDIIGATAGIQLGNVVMIMLYSSAAVSNVLLRYRFCYGFTAVCVLAVLILGRLAGDKRESYSVMEMVMMGSIVSQALNVAAMYIMYNLEDEDLLIYQELTLGTYLETDHLNLAIMMSVIAVSILPVLIMRYRMNILGMDQAETRSLGIEPRGLRVFAQICGAMMVTAAMIHCGQVGMVSVVVPYAVRQFFGSDFRYVCIYSAVLGGALLVVCRMLTSFVLIAENPLPLTFVVSVVLMPGFMVIIARQRRDDI